MTEGCWSETVACSIQGARRAEASAVYASKTGVLQTGGRKRERFPTGWRGQQIAPWARTAVHTVSIADLHGSSFVAPNSYTSPGKGSAETLQGKQQVTHALHAVTETHCDDLQVQRGKLTIYTPVLKYMHFIWACQCFAFTHVKWAHDRF